MKSIVSRLWNSSPASITRAIGRRVVGGNDVPGWHTIKAGPGAGARLFLPASNGAWAEMIAGVFDQFLYDALLKKRDVRGAVCWDVGAHIGYHTLSLASLGAEVVAFEPTPQNAARLRQHLEKNPELAKRIQLREVALSDKEGESVFVQCNDVSSGSSGSHLADALPPMDSSAYKAFERKAVPTTQIDRLIERGEKAPEIMKIDVEGGELLVLQGGRRLLEQRGPILLMEIHHICLMHQIQTLLLETGYESRILDKDHATPSRCFIMAEKRA